MTRKLLVKPCRMRKSCCKGFRRSPDAWKALLALRRSYWQSSGPSCVQTLLRPRRRISHGRDGFGQETNLERTRFAWRVFRAVMASGALPKPGKRCFRRGGATGKPKRGGGRARQRNWITVKSTSNAGIPLDRLKLIGAGGIREAIRVYHHLV